MAYNFTQILQNIVFCPMPTSAEKLGCGSDQVNPTVKTIHLTAVPLFRAPVGRMFSSGAHPHLLKSKSFKSFSDEAFGFIGCGG
jgi:hypothetical protein